MTIFINTPALLYVTGATRWCEVLGRKSGDLYKIVYITNRDMSMKEDPRKHILNFAKDNPSVKALKVSILYNWSGSHW